MDWRGGDDRGEKKEEEELVQKEDNCLKGEDHAHTFVYGFDILPCEAMIQTVVVQIL